MNPNIAKIQTAIGKYNELADLLAKLIKEAEKEAKKSARLEADADPLDSKGWAKTQADIAASKSRVAALGSEITKVSAAIESLGDQSTADIRDISPGVAKRLTDHIQTLREDIALILLPLCVGDKNLAYQDAARTPLYVAAVTEFRAFDTNYYSSPEVALQHGSRIISAIEKLDSGAPYFVVPKA